MPESYTAQSRFHMVGARAAILNGPVTEAIEQQIHAIENALENVPDFAFDLSKALVESVCKTVLADIGQPANPRWNAPKLLRETTNRLSPLPGNDPNLEVRETVRKTIGGLLQTIHGCVNFGTNTAWLRMGATVSPLGLISDRQRLPHKLQTRSCPSCTVYIATR